MATRPRRVKRALFPERCVMDEKHTSIPEEDLVVDADMSEIINDFVLEPQEYLDQLDQSLVGLEKNPEDKEIIGTVFRLLHTTKGNARGLGFELMEKAVHRTEDVI